MEDHLKKEILDVYLHGQPIGKLYSDNATLSFAYTPEYPDGQLGALLGQRESRPDSRANRR